MSVSLLYRAIIELVLHGQFIINSASYMNKHMEMLCSKLQDRLLKQGYLVKSPEVSKHLHNPKVRFLVLQ